MSMPPWPPSDPAERRRLIKVYEVDYGVAEEDIPRFRADWAELYGQRELHRPGLRPELPPSGLIDGVPIMKRPERVIE